VFAAFLFDHIKTVTDFNAFYALCHNRFFGVSAILDGQQHWRA